jgi:threonine dehydratase
VTIKLETANAVRSFKARGTELVAACWPARAAAVCAGAGNLDQALGWSGRRSGPGVTAVASRRAHAAKLDGIHALGAELELVDGDFEMACERAVSIAQRRGVRLVADSLDVENREGAATIALELWGTGRHQALAGGGANSAATSTAISMARAASGEWVRPARQCR